MLGLALAAIFGWGLYRLIATVPYRPPAGSATAGEVTLVGVDPNSAEWWELTVIPGIGEVTAKKIVDYRQACRRDQGLPDDAPVFRSAADLQRVKGIGPKKAEAAEPYLTFDAAGKRPDAVEERVSEGFSEPRP